MDHLAILKKNWLKRILSSEKTIESRWYKTKKTPFNNIKPGDLIYFKEIGKQVNVIALVKDALFFENLNEKKIIKIINNYGNQICMNRYEITKLLGKKYCTLIFLKDVKMIKPFDINKKGYGNMCAWISVNNIDELKASGRI